MINNIKELHEYLGRNYTIAYRSKYSDVVMVNGVIIVLPISRNDLSKELNYVNWRC